jgi:hypothetical protein
VRPCRKICTLSCLLVLWSCLSSRVAVLSSRLLSGVQNRCQALWNVRFSPIFLFCLDRAV